MKPPANFSAPAAKFNAWFSTAVLLPLTTVELLVWPDFFSASLFGLAVVMSAYCTGRWTRIRHHLKGRP